MISKIKNRKGLPISVIVPVGQTSLRQEFFQNFTLPLIKANNPKEIIIDENPVMASRKRNHGYISSSQPFVFFCDDDILLPKNYLKTLLWKLDRCPNKGYAYSGYYGIVIDPSYHPLKKNFIVSAGTFDAEKLKQDNYISSMSLIRRTAFPMFDVRLKRFQDWDLYLTMLKNGWEGIYVAETFFYAYYLDQGITSDTNDEEKVRMLIKLKHKL